MPWLRLDDRFTKHPKILKLKRNDRWTWLEILEYCAAYKTAGHVPEAIAEVIPHATPTLIKQLVNVGLLDSEPSGYHVHDWDEYNPRDPTHAERQRRYRERQASQPTVTRDANRDGQSDEARDVSRDAESDAPRAGRRARPVPNPEVTTAADVYVEHAPAAAENIEPLKLGGWNATQLAAAASDPDRALALLAEAEADASVANPAALAWSKFSSGAQPTDQRRSEIAPGAQGTRSTSKPLPVSCPYCEWTGWPGERDAHVAVHEAEFAPPPEELVAQVLARGVDPDPEPAPSRRPLPKEAPA